MFTPLPLIESKWILAVKWLFVLHELAKSKKAVKLLLLLCLRVCVRVNLWQYSTHLGLGPPLSLFVECVFLLWTFIHRCEPLSGCLARAHTFLNSKAFRLLTPPTFCQCNDRQNDNNATIFFLNVYLSSLQDKMDKYVPHLHF